MKFLIVIFALSMIIAEAVYNPELEYPQPASPLASQMADEAVKKAGADPFGNPEPTVNVPVQRFKRLILNGEKNAPSDTVI
uniref:Uncharacterized protein n=1 Tax=Panagrolaimus superbus TaxID=310955 RepID=A0A914Z661_9BILA